jgi:hypothetical protein
MLTRLIDRSRVTVYPRLVVGGLVLAWVVSALLGQGGLDRAGNVIGTDFLAFYSAATLIAEDPGADPYDLEVLGARQRELVPAMSETEVVAYLSPPTALLLFRPLALLPLWPALGVWTLLNLGAWVGALLLLHRTFLGPRWSATQVLGTSALFVPVVLGFLYGQGTGLVALIWAASLRAVMKGHEGRGGAILALLVFKPQLALAIALPLLLKGRVRALAAGAIVTVALVGITALVWPDQWPHAAGLGGFATEVITAPNYPTWGVVSLFGAASLLLGWTGGSLPAIVTVVSSVAVLALLAVAWRRTDWNTNTVQWQLTVAATLLLGLLLSIHLYTYDLALALVGFWLVIGALGLEPGSAPPLEGDGVLRWSALVWAVAFVGPILTLFLGVLLAAVLGVPATVGVTTFVAGAAGLRLLGMAGRQ